MGTAATRAEIIEGLKRQKLIELKGKKLFPTEMGFALFTALGKAAPQIVDPGATARLEAQLDGIQSGATDPETVHTTAYAATSEMIAGAHSSAA